MKKFNLELIAAVVIGILLVLAAYASFIEVAKNILLIIVLPATLFIESVFKYDSKEYCKKSNIKLH